MEKDYMFKPESNVIENKVKQTPIEKDSIYEYHEYLKRSMNTNGRSKAGIWEPKEH